MLHDIDSRRTLVMCQALMFRAGRLAQCASGIDIHVLLATGTDTRVGLPGPLFANAPSERDVAPQHQFCTCLRTRTVRDILAKSSEWRPSSHAGTARRGGGSLQCGYKFPPCQNL